MALRPTRWLATIIDESQRTSLHVTTNGFHLTPLGDLLQQPYEARVWIVENRLALSSFNLLAGRPKAGKSTLGRCLAFCVARGEPWLGFPTTPSTVVYLGLEEKADEVKRHFELMGATGEEPIDIHCGAAPLDGVQQLRKIIEQQQPGLVVLDPLFRLVRVSDANDYARVTAALDPVLRMARESSTCIAAVHHIGKSQRDGGEAILGSTAIYGTADTVLLLKQFERYRTLGSRQRYGPDLEDVVLDLDAHTGMVVMGATKREADEQGAQAAIEAFLRRFLEPFTEAEVLAGVKGRKATKEFALRQLVATRRIRRTGAGRRGDPFRYSLVSPSLPLPKRPEEEEERRVDEGPSDSPSAPCASQGGGSGREQRLRREESAEGSSTESVGPRFRPSRPCPECGKSFRQLGWHRHMAHSSGQSGAQNLEEV